MVMRKISNMDGLRIGGLNDNNIQYRDDTAIVADSEEQLQHFFSVIADESRKFGLEINKGKTFCMTISTRSVSPKCKLDIDEIKIKQVKRFEYLRSLVTSYANSDQEIKQRIGIAKTAFKGMPNVLTARDINNQTKLRLIKS